MPVTTLDLRVPGQGLHEFTTEAQAAVRDFGVRQGLCTFFIQHTSASLTIQENADPSAKRDLEQWLNRLVPENDPLYTHTSEGPDDMPAHIKAILTATSLSIPVLDGPPGPRHLARPLSLGASPTSRASAGGRPLHR